MKNWSKVSAPDPSLRPPTEHAPHCPEPWMEWQADIVPGLARRGRCIHCGAVEIDRRQVGR